MQLGEARRTLGQRAGVWDKAANDKLVARLGGEADGKISGENFVKYFAEQMKDLSNAEFEETIKHFKLVARECQTNASSAMHMEESLHTSIASPPGSSLLDMH